MSFASDRVWRSMCAQNFSWLFTMVSISAAVLVGYFLLKLRNSACFVALVIVLGMLGVGGCEGGLANLRLDGLLIWSGAKRVDDAQQIIVSHLSDDKLRRFV